MKRPPIARLHVKPMSPLRFVLTLACGLLAFGCRRQQAEEPVQRIVLFGPSQEAGTVTEADALAIARRAVGTNDARYPDWLATNVFYRARSHGRGWDVFAEIIIGTNDSGQPLSFVGDARFIGVDERGAVTHYWHGH